MVFRSAMLVPLPLFPDFDYLSGRMLQKTLVLFLLCPILLTSLQLKEKEGKGFAFSADLLYFKATEDSLRYAEIVPQTPTYNPIISYLDQEFVWDPGLRVSLVLPKMKKYEISGGWTYFQAKPPTVTASDPHYGIVAGLATPIIGYSGNFLTNSVVGRWQFQMNAFELAVKSNFEPWKSFQITPSFGLFGASIHQSVSVQYGDFLIFSTVDNTPQSVKGTSQMKAIGPLIGVGFKYKCLFANANMSWVYSWFNLATTYLDMLSAPPHATIKMIEPLQRLLPYAQAQAGLSTRWVLSSSSAKREVSMELSAGWEGQIWGGQMRMNWFSTIVNPQDGSSFTLNGLFARCRLDF
jgi:hypothetical protein